MNKPIVLHSVAEINSYLDNRGYELVCSNQELESGQFQKKELFFYTLRSSKKVGTTICFWPVLERDIIAGNFSFDGVIKHLSCYEAPYLMLLVQRLNSSPMICLFSFNEIEKNRISKIEVLSRMISLFGATKLLVAL